jgi:hypothetical protein
MTADLADLVSFGLLGVVEVPPYLAVHPEAAGGAEVSGEPERGARCDATTTVDDHVDPLVGHTDGLGELSVR